MITIRVNGVPCTAPREATVLEVARARGIEVPTLCHEPRLEPRASCWVCVVEVRQGAGWRTVPACATRVAPEMEVRTDSETVHEARRWALELLLSDHDADCVAPCTLACPAGVDIQAYVAAVARGDDAGAVEIVRRTNPLPSVCGRVCPHPCEAACRRGLVDEAVAINPLKRLATSGPLPATPAPAADSGHRVAVVGAGPAGLSAAYFLRLAGHAVTVFEAQGEAGGMLRYGIPAYRLPREVLEADLAALAALGVVTRFGQRLGRDFTVEGLRGEGYGAVFVATGAWKGRRLGLPGEDAAGVRGGVELLYEVNRGTLAALAGRVAVIGGGNTAVDAARAARRLGASEVTLLYRRARDQMPAFAHEVSAAEAEGVRIVPMVAPVAIEIRDGRAVGVRLIEMAPGPPDASGRPTPVPIPGSERLFPAELVLRATGETPDLAGLEGLSNQSAGVTDQSAGRQAGGMTIDSATQAAGLPGVFAGGDLATGPATAVEAIGAGRRAAAAIDRFLRTEEVRAIPAPVYSRRDLVSRPAPGDYPDVPRRARAAQPERPVAGRCADFGEVEQGLAPAAGRLEATRCLECGCRAFSTCALRPLLDTYRPDARRLAGEAHRYPRAWLRPGIRLDMNKCIRCGRCVGICREVVGVGAIDFIRRGFDTELFFGLPCGDEAAARCDTCLAGGAPCVETCPTGALEREG